MGLKYLNAYPMPNVAGRVQQNYVIQRQQTQNFDDFDIRADWNATQNDRVFARTSYAHDKEDTSTRLPGLPAGYGSGNQFTYGHGGAVGLTHIFSPSLFNDLRLGFQRSELGYLPPYGNVPISANLGIPNANTSSLLGGGALIGGYNSQLEYTGDYGTYRVPENTYQLAEVRAGPKAITWLNLAPTSFAAKSISSGRKPARATSIFGAMASDQDRPGTKRPTSSPAL